MLVQILKNWLHKQTPVATSWARQHHRGRSTLPTAQTRWTCNRQSRSSKLSWSEKSLDSCREHPQIANLSVIRRFDYDSNDHVACLFVHHVGSTSSTTTISLNSTPVPYILGRHIPSASSTVHNQHEAILTHDRKTIHHHVCPCVRHSTIQSQHLIEASEPVVASFSAI